MEILFCLLLLSVIAYVYKKVENPYVKILLIVSAIPVTAYALLFYIVWGMGRRNSDIAASLPCILLIGFLLFKAVQWQRQKSKRKSDDSD